MARALWVALILVASLTSGCLGLGSVEPADIPEEGRDDWRQTRNDRQDYAGGLAELVTVEYEPPENAVAKVAGVMVATLNDLPILDERERLIPIALKKIEEDRGVEFVESGTRSMELVNLGSMVEGTEYDIRQGPNEAKGVLFTPDCEDFVVVVAYGPLADGGEDGNGSLPIIGDDPTGTTAGSAIENHYAKARSIAKTVVC